MIDKRDVFQISFEQARGSIGLQRRLRVSVVHDVTDSSPNLIHYFLSVAFILYWLRSIFFLSIGSPDMSIAYRDGLKSIKKLANLNKNGRKSPVACDLYQTNPNKLL